MMLSRSHRAPLPLVLGFLLLVVCAVSTIFLIGEQRTAERWVRHTNEVEQRLDHAQIHVARAEINRRGYLLSGDEPSLRTFETIVADVPRELDGLVSAVADNPPQEARAVALRSVMLAKIAEERLSIRLRRDGRSAEAVAIVAGAESRGRTATLLKTVDAMRANEADLLALRVARNETLRSAAQIALFASAALILALALLVGRERRLRLIALGEANRALETDIAARTALEAELTTARTRAEAAGKAKSAFLADMSHEIRTPMNGVLGFTELLLDTELTADQRHQVELIADSGRAMMRLLNDILDLSKIEAGKMPIVVEPFDLPHTLRACAKLMAPAIRQRGLTFEVDIADDLPPKILGDGLRMRQILLNLLGNAAKFTPEGYVALRARVASGGRSLIVEVEDSGIGIDPDRQRAVFEQFEQADAAIAPRFGGTGLGLSISAQLATLMGGSLSLESAPGRGSRFVLDVALRTPAIPAGDALPIPAPRSVPTDRTGRSLRLLVAEDHDINQMLIREMLARLGHRVHLVTDGEQAVAAVASTMAGDDPYALVLMDMQMPNVDGIEATRRIRAAGVGPDRLPILALTANAYSDDIAACLSSGMQAHLAKPFDGAELASAIERWAASAPAAAIEGAGRFSPQLRERYAARRAEMIAMVSALADGERPSEGDWAEMGRALHKFLGSAEMFGDVALARIARTLESDMAGWPRARRRDELRRAADAMRRAA